MKGRITKLTSMVLVFVMVLGSVGIFSAVHAVGEVLTHAQTPPENVFQVGDKSFILLDSQEEGGQKSYLILSKDFYDQRYYGGYSDYTNTSGSYDKFQQKFVVSENDGVADYDTYVGYWLNNEFFNRTDNTGLPVDGEKKMTDYILLSEWATEAGYENGNCPQEYTVQCKIALPSKTELQTYADKIGYLDDAKVVNQFGWWTRTGEPYPSRAKAVTTVATGGAAAGNFSYSNGRPLETRPIFRLSADFFKNMKMNASTAGDNVKAMLQADFTKEDLQAAGYSETEFTLLGFEGAEIVKPTVSDVTISGTFETTETAVANFTLGDSCDAGKTIVEWQTAEFADGESYGEYVTKAKGNEVVITNVMATAIEINTGAVSTRRLLRAAVTPVSADGVQGDTVYSEGVLVAPALGPINRVTNGNGNTLSVVNTNTPDEHVFTVAGKSFILLDETEETVPKYFILSKDYYGARKIEDVKANWSGYNTNFEPTDRNTTVSMEKKHISYWLNSSETGGFLNSENVEGLPAAVRAKLDMSHVWKTEANADMPNDYKFAAGVTLLSLTELKQYADKIGLVDDIATSGAAGGWWLRSGYGNEKESVMFVDAKNVGQTTRWKGNPLAVRPAFYLTNDFFTTAKLENIAALGDNIKDMLKKNYTKDALKAAGYTDEELALIWGEAVIQKPEAADVTVTLAHNEIGATVKGGYRYVGDDEGETLFNWQQSASEDSGFTDIAGATAINFTVTNAQAEKYLRLKVTPVNAQGVKGDAVYSLPTAKLPVAFGPVDREYENVNPLTVKDTPAENVLRLSGSDKEFILLDYDLKNMDSRFFILSKDYYGGPMQFDTAAQANGGYQKFDLTREGNVASWLNGSFLEGNSLPSGMVDALDYTHRWVTEGGFSGGSCPNDYTVAAPVALLSKTEFMKYQDKIGYADGVSGNGWWLRTARGINGGTSTVLFVRNNPAHVGAYDSFGTLAVRPAFWLGKNFFTAAGNRLDLDTLGENVKKAIRANYTKEELLASGIYTESEITFKLGYTEYEIADCSFTFDENGASVKADVTVAAREKAGNVTVILGVYDKSNKLVAGKSKKLNLEAGGQDSAELRAEGFSAVTDGRVQVMLWSDFSGLIPLCPSVEREYTTKQQ